LISRAGGKTDGQVGGGQTMRVVARTAPVLAGTTVARADISAAQRSGVSCRLAAVANATDTRSEMASKRQKSPDLARRKAVSYTPLFGGGLNRVKGQGVGWLCNAMVFFEYRPDRFE